MVNINVYLLIISFSFMFDIGNTQDTDQWKQITEKDELPSDVVGNILLDSLGNNWIFSKKGVSIYDGENWQHFTKKNGLPSNNIYSVILNYRGNPWFIHKKGMSKFDGKNFIPMETLKIKPESLIFVDKQSNIWITQKKGKIIIYNGESFEIIKKKDIQFSCYLVDSKGNVWLAGKSSSPATPGWSYIHIFDGKIWSKYKNISGSEYDKILTIYEDKNEDIWVGMKSGLYKKDKNSFSFENGEKPWPDEKPVRSIFNNNSGDLCVFMAKYYGIGEHKQAVSKLMKLSGDTWESSPEISFRFFRGIMQDSRGNIWIGYGNGVFRYNGFEFTKYSKEVGYNDRPGFYTTKLYEDSKGNIWVGSSYSLSRYDGENWELFPRSIKSKSNVNPNSVNSICEDSNGNILFGTNKGVFIYSY